MISRRDLLITGALASVSTRLLAAPVYEAGKQYLIVDPAVATPADTIEVVDFFAYTCPHCLRFAKVFEEWEEHLPEGVTVRKCPVAWDARTVPFVKTYYALESLGKLNELHMPFFHAVIEQTFEFTIQTAPEDIAKYMVANGIKREDWDAAYNSFMVNSQAMQATQLWQSYGVDATPRVGVAGRYLTGPDLVGRLKDTTACIDYLVDLVRKNRGR